MNGDGTGVGRTVAQPRTAQPPGPATACEYHVGGVTVATVRRSLALSDS